MLYREQKIERILKRMEQSQNDRHQSKDRKQTETGQCDKPEKKDYVAMLLASILTFLPAAIAVVFILSLALLQFV